MSQDFMDGIEAKPPVSAGDLPAPSKARKKAGARPVNAQALRILKICAACFALISWVATAQGLGEYVFRGSSTWQAYVLSFAIQGALLVLNFRIPAFVSKMRFEKRVKKRRGEAAQDQAALPPPETAAPAKKTMPRWYLAPILVLYSLALCVSSGFSFVYITDLIYASTWPMDSEIIVDSKYREELYNFKDYVNRYLSVSEYNLSAGIEQLYSYFSNGEGSASASNFTFDWAQERTEHVTNGGDGAEQMEFAIGLLENLTDKSPQTDYDNAIDQVTRIRDSFVTLKDQSAQSASDRQADYDGVNASLTSITRQISQSTGDTSALEREQANLQEELRTYREEKKLYETQRDAYQKKVDRLNLYLSTLTGVQNTAQRKVPEILLQIQRELAKTGDEIDINALSTNMDLIYDEVLGSADMTALSGLTGDEQSSYSKMLTVLKQLRSEVKDYKQLQESRVKVETMIEGLNVSNAAAVLTSDARNIPEEDLENWRQQWMHKLNNLKMEIKSVPTFLQEDYAELPETMQNTVREIAAYDSQKAADHLDSTMRDWLADLNVMEKAAVYLGGRFKFLALLSLGFALFMDTAAILVGIVIYANQTYVIVKPKKEEDAEKSPAYQ